MPRPYGTAAELERRRTRAVQLLEQGESPTTIARILGVHVTSVHRWRRLAHLEAWDRRDRISVISGITLSPLLARPGLYFQLLPVKRTVHAEEVVAYLQELRRQLRGPFTVIWDRHRIHSKSKVVQAYLADHPEIVVEDLPAYAPQLNPDEWVWNWTKYGRLSNLAAWNSDHLENEVIDALVDLKFRPDLLNGFLKDAELPLAA